MVLDWPNVYYFLFCFGSLFLFSTESNKRERKSNKQKREKFMPSGLHWKYTAILCLFAIVHFLAYFRTLSHAKEIASLTFFTSIRINLSCLVCTINNGIRIGIQGRKWMAKMFLYSNRFVDFFTSIFFILKTSNTEIKLPIRISS